MKEEINEEVRQLLESLEEHGKNIRRQAQLNDLIDELAAKEKTVEMPQKRRKLVPLWWAMGAAAACLLLWLLVKPASKQTPKMNEEILVEKMETIDSVQIKEKKEVIFEEPIVEEKHLAEETPVVPQKKQTKKEKPKIETIERVIEQSVFAEVVATKNADTVNLESNNIPIVNDAPLAVQIPTTTRRVIKSTNLVGYGKLEKTAAEPKSKRSALENKTLFGQPQDPNMKDGMLAYEIKF